VAACFLLFTGLLPAQHGTAPNGYYPPGYAGDTWTGEVTDVNDTTREITLTYRKKNKMETFTGALELGYKVRSKSGGEHELKVSEIPLGTQLTVYYMAKWRKVERKKVEYYEILRLATVPSDKK
jgi:hypothetical protein